MPDQVPNPPLPLPTLSLPGRIWSFIRNHGIVAVGIVIVTVFTPFLIVSESTMKKFVESWLNDCVLVFEVREVKGNRLLVTGYAQGKLPTALPITFSAKGAEINSIHFINEVERPGADRFTSLAIHPQSNTSCPGPLCESLGNLTSALNVTVFLSDIHPSFVYPFYVDFNGMVSTDNLRLFVQYDPGIKETVCRVERAHLFNLFVRLSKFGQFVAAVLAFVCLTILLAAARILIKGDGT